MTLLITLFAAIVCTTVWYRHAPQDELKVGLLGLIFWGASLMWLVDALVAYSHSGPSIFSPVPQDMLNDTFLGLSAVAFGLIIWLAYVLVKDPRGVVKSALLNR